MKRISSHILLFLIILLLSPEAHTQNKWIDSLKKVASTQKADTNKVWTLKNIADYYAFNSPDSGIIFGKQALVLAEQLHYDKGIFWSIVSLDHSLFVSGNYTLELEYALKAIPIAKRLNDKYASGWSNGMLADSYVNLGDYHTAMIYIRLIIKNIELYFPDELFSGYAAIVPVYVGLHKYDSALICARKSFALLKAAPTLYNGNGDESKYAKGQVYLSLGQAFEGKANYDSALFFYRRSMPYSDDINTKIFKVDALNGIAKSYKEKDYTDSAIWYANLVLQDKIIKTYPSGKLKAVNLLADIYELKKDTDSSLRYLRIAVNLKDSIYNREKTTAFQNSLLREQEKQKEIQAATTALQNRYTIYFLVALFITATTIAGIVIRNKRIKQFQNIRNSIADDLHDDIGSALSSISIMNELAKAKSPEALPLLASIGENTVTIQENMSDIVWAMKSGNNRFENVVQRMNQFAAEILDAKNIDLDFVSDESLSGSKLTMENRKNLYLFFKEVINNTAKHADAKKVSVCIAHKDHCVELKVRDDGKGFDTNKIFGGNGMNTLKKRAAELNAKLTIKSQVNDGTVVQLIYKIT